MSLSSLPGPFFMRCLSFVTLKSAGSRVRVKKSDTITPSEAKIPRSEIGATSLPENEPIPMAVVMDVIAMASPEWCMVKAIASFLSPLVLNRSKKMESTCTVAPTLTARIREGTICVGSLNATPAHPMVPTVTSRERIMTISG